jgi:hypothetical protein
VDETLTENLVLEVSAFEAAIGRAAASVDAFAVSVAETNKKNDASMEASAKKASKTWEEFFATARRKLAEWAMDAARSLASMASSFVQSASEAAMAYEDLSGRFEKTFGTAAAATRQWAESFGTAMGRSKTEMLQQLTSSQSMLRSLGMTREAAAKMSVEIAKVTADLASFYDVEDAEMMASLTSAMLGRTQALRGYGIALDEGKIKEELLSGAQGKTKDTASAEELVMARLRAVVKATGDAHGDAAEKAGTLEGQLRRMDSATKDIKLEFGAEINKQLTKMIVGMGGAEASALQFARGLRYAQLAALLLAGPVVTAFTVVASMITTTTEAMIYGLRLVTQAGSLVSDTMARADAKLAQAQARVVNIDKGIAGVLIKTTDAAVSTAQEINILTSRIADAEQQAANGAEQIRIQNEKGYSVADKLAGIAERTAAATERTAGAAAAAAGAWELQTTESGTGSRSANWIWNPTPATESPEKFAAGGIVGGAGRGDKVPALLEPGEAVLPRSLVAALDRLNRPSLSVHVTAQTPADQRGARELARCLVPEIQRAVSRGIGGGHWA